MPNDDLRDHAVEASVGPDHDAAPTTPHEAGARASHVLLFNARREMMLRHHDAPGLPHGGSWTSGIVTDVRPGESYDLAAARALRDALGARLDADAVRLVGNAWVDAPGGRAFLAVFAAAWEGPAPSGCVFVPVQTVFRALRQQDASLDPAFARAARLVRGDDDW